MTESEIIPPNAPLQRPEKTPVLGILSLIVAGLSFIPFMGVLSLLGLFFGILALIFRQPITGILGTSLSLIGIILSPTVWVLGICLIAAMYSQERSCIPTGKMEKAWEQWEEIPAAPTHRPHSKKLDEEDGEDL